MLKQEYFAIVNDRGHWVHAGREWVFTVPDKLMARIFTDFADAEFHACLYSANILQSLRVVRYV